LKTLLCQPIQSFLILLKATGHIAEEFLKAAINHIKGFPKAAGVDIFFANFAKHLPAVFGKPFIWILAT
jgi:hypothetical protein